MNVGIIITIGEGQIVLSVVEFGQVWARFWAIFWDKASFGKFMARYFKTASFR